MSRRNEALTYVVLGLLAWATALILGCVIGYAIGAGHG